jgi:hypothetical protein
VHLNLPAVLLTVVYAAAVAVAVTAPGEHIVAGLVVLTGLVSRWAVRHRRGPRAVPLATAVDAVLAPEAGPSPAAAA